MMGMEPCELRCNACGAALHYEEGAAVITCAHCGTEYALETQAEGVFEFTIEEAEEEIPAVEALAAPEMIAPAPRSAARATLVVAVLIAVAVSVLVIFLLLAR
jgi:LSD1 subclass zinc finger protein